MSRKMLVRKVTFTTVKLAKLERVNGVTQAVDLPDELLLGNRTVEQAQKLINKEFPDQSVQVMEVQADTKEYELPIMEFVKVAKVREPKKENKE